MTGWTRRELLAGLPIGLVFGRVLVACAEGVDEGQVSVEGWVEIALEDHPQLGAVGGAAQITRPDKLLDVWVIHAAPGEYLAAWRICTHGACYLEWRAASAHLECPCHGSTFGLDGAPTRGPATRPLRVLRVIRRDGRLYIERP